jgi:hypothetical protein
VSSIILTEAVATFPKVVAGKYFVMLDVANYGFAKIPNDDIGLFPISADFVVDSSSLVQVESSFAGGQEIVITGFGFDAETEAYIHGQSLDLINSTFESITFLTPPLMTVQSVTDFGLQTKENVHDQITHLPISDTGKLGALVNDEDWDTSYDSNSQHCWVGFNFETNQVEIHEIQFRVAEGSDLALFENSTVEVSDDGQTWTVLATVGSVIPDAWNSLEIAGAPTHQFVRMGSNMLNKSCAYTEINVMGRFFLKDAQNA